MNSTPDWLSLFFGSHNRLDLDKYIAGTYSADRMAFLAPMLERALKDKPPFILPLVNSERQVGFYLSDKEERTLVELQSFCRSFLGTADSHPDFRIRKVGQNPSELALLDRMPLGFIRIRVLNSDNQNALQRVRDSLVKMVDLMEQRPDLIRVNRRPTGRILRDFFIACQAGNSTAAQDFLKELRSHSGLSPFNLSLLEVQALAAGRRWQEILQYKGLEMMLSGRLPAGVVGPLLDALAHKTLGDGAIGEVSVAEVRVFCQPLKHLFLRTPRIALGQEVNWRVWAIGAAALGEKDFISNLPTCITSAWLEELCKWAGLPAPADPFTTALPQQSQALIPSLPERLLFVDLENAEGLLAELANLPEEEQQRLRVNPRIAHLWDSLLQETNGSRMGWNCWFQEMTSSGTGRIDVLEQAALLESKSWLSEDFNAPKILECLTAAWSVPSAMALRNVMPVMMGWLCDHEIRCPSEFWNCLLTNLALDEIYSRQDLVLAGQLAEEFLAESHTVRDYRLVIESLDVLWQKLESPDSAQDALDLVEMFSLHTTPDRAALDGFTQTVLQFCRGHREQLSPLCTAFACDLAQDLYGEEATKGLNPSIAVSADTPGLDLSGKLLAIYTLMESAGRRAKKYLEQHYPGLKVVINSDHQATDTLINLAESAHYFIFATRSSKHQAFYPVVERFRKRGQELIYPAGKGTTSMVESFEAALLR